jgi:hypothetical protein
MKTNIAATSSSTNLVSTIKNPELPPSYRKITGFLTIFVAGSVLRYATWPAASRSGGTGNSMYLVAEKS